jgi:hypothetical protein
MKLSIVLAAAAALLIAASALAQAPVPANQRYCLEAMDDTGPNPLLCRFATLEQCNASRTGGSDRCVLNPALAFQRR